MSKPDTPAAPDYTGAANATAAGSVEAIKAQTQANRVNSYSPYGSVEYTKGVGGNPDAWASTTTLSPAQQKILDQQQALQTGFGDIAQSALPQVQDAVTKGIDWNALPASQINAGQTAQDAIMARLEPQFANEKKANENRLANQGIYEGSEAYNGSMNNLAQQKNDAYVQAALQGMNAGTAQRQQALSEQQLAANMPINLINALRTGTQVVTPTGANTAPAGQAQGVDYTGAAQNAYNAALGNANVKNAQYNGNVNAAATIGSGLLNYFS